jgi:hypothetical protein
MHIFLVVALVMLAGFLHIRQPFGKTSQLKWWIMLSAIWIIGAIIAAYAVDAPIKLMLLFVWVPLTVGLCLDYISALFRNGFHPKKPGWSCIICGMILFLFFSGIPTSLSPLIAIAAFVLYTVPAAFAIGGAHLVHQEKEPPKQHLQETPHTHCHTD